MWTTALTYLLRYGDEAFSFLAEHRMWVYRGFAALALVAIGYMLRGPQATEQEGGAVRYIDTPFDYDHLTQWTVPDVTVNYRPVLNRETIDSLHAANDSLKAAIADRHEGIRDTVILAPTGLTRFDLAPEHPVEVSGNEVTITTFNTRTYRWQKRTFSVDKTWTYAVDLSALYAPLAGSYAVEATGSLSYKRLGVEATLGHQRNFYALLGVTYSLWSN